ncbi:MAG: flagellar biosynthesis regulator FlaF [Thiobacillus sp.]
MSPEQQIHQAQRSIHHADLMLGEAAQLDDVAIQLMSVQRYWNTPSRDARLNAALAASRTVWQGIQNELAKGSLVLPLEAQHNLLILSVYADSKITVCESIPCEDTLSSLIALTRTLAGSLKEWREAA